MPKKAKTSQTAALAPGLLAVARSQGERDVYAGKRGWIRYTLGMRTEVTTDPTIPFASWPVTTHNISGGGLGFWSKRPLDVGTPIHILDVSDDSAPVWIPARVVHCTMGIRGYLLGAHFDVPGQPDDPAALQPDEQQAAAEVEDVGDELDCTLPSLARRGAACVAVVGLAATAAAVIATQALVGPNAVLVACAAGAVVCCGLGPLVVYRMLSADLGLTRPLNEALRALATGRKPAAGLPEARVRELAGVRLAFLELQARARRREEGERVQRQRLEEVNQMKGNLIAIVSHDLRTPLTSILLYARMLNEDLDELSHEDKRNFLTIIADECTRLSRLVDDLLEVQRLESDRVQWDLREQDLSEAIRSSASLFEAMARSKSIELSVDCPVRLPSVVADTDKIAQVLSNLVSNAIKYTQPGGRIEVSAADHGQHILMRISDSGPGIPRDMWDGIFDRFSQIRDPDVSDIAGVGLGLYIVKKIIEGHGGAVWVDSEVGVGSQFYISLPVRGDCPPTVPVRVIAEGEAYRVLICDPDPQLAAVIGQALRQHGYEVRMAHSGKRLLAHMAHGDLDMVITDVLLPDISADRLLAGVHAMTQRSFKLIAHSYVEDGKPLKHPAIDIFRARPVSKENLVELVQDTLRDQAPAAGRRVPRLSAGASVTRSAGPGERPVEPGRLP